VIRLALRVARADAELVLADLLELAPAGVEEIELSARDGIEGQVEYAVYGAPGELPELPDLQALAGGVKVELSSSEVPDDWAERWKRFHRPVLVETPGGSVPSLHVRPPWEAALNRDDVCEIVIDPAQAFGTGAHATTRLCLELLLVLAAEDSARPAVLDVGTGSGVLAIAAAKLGYDPVLALDNDPLSVAATEVNASAAGVALEARLFDLRSEPLPLGEGGEPGQTLMLSNLLRPLLLEMAGAIAKPPEHLIASGLLREEVDEIAHAYAERFDLRERERRTGGDWAALWLTRR
jgi:ribosomal protein L11 methyltransferase